ncbi:DUF4625 domain-containing protein [Bacteroides reticulotermitis]|uniref:DUF4625 domain-containing protein n=1 Tax=Bacteroides reticulotermitis TaxID=1133319 RepID=UPI003A89DD7D
MKTKFYIPMICLLAVCSFTFLSCDSDDDSNDTTKPLIDLLEPEEGQELKIGAETGVHFEMDLSDDVMLKSYKIEIHNNFDHHSHSRAVDETVAFSFNKTYDLTGQKTAHVHHHDIIIPANATPGDYHLMVYCTDAAGNETYVARNIVLSLTADDDHDHDHEE